MTETQPEQPIWYKCEKCGGEISGRLSGLLQQCPNGGYCQKTTSLLPREGKAQEPQHDGSDHFYAENFSNFKGWGEQDKTDTPVASLDLGDELEDELEDGCYMMARGEDGLCRPETGCQGCAQERRLRSRK